MAYVEVPKDLGEVKTKIIFGLTSRQLVHLLAGGLLGIGTYLIARNKLGDSAASLLLMIVSGPVIVSGFYSKDGKTLMQYLKMILQDNLTPRKRIYQTNNKYKIKKGRENSGNKNIKNRKKGTREKR